MTTLSRITFKHRLLAALCAGLWLPAHAGDPHVCTRITSAVQRLACFDAAMGTPAAPMPSITKASAPTDRPSIVALVRANEATRPPGDTRVRVSPLSAENASAPLVISVPPIGATVPSPYLAISCVAHISRLQLVLGQPLTQNQVNVRLLLDGQPVTASQPWQVLDPGVVVDAGRGLPAIDTLRQLRNGGRLTVRSNSSALDGLVFNAQGLGDAIAQQREACRW